MAEEDSVRNLHSGLIILANDTREKILAPLKVRH